MTKFLGKEFYVDSSSKFVDKVEFDSSTYFNSIASYDPNNIPILNQDSDIVHKQYIDSSLSELYNINNIQDTSISNLYQENDAQDVSINNLQSKDSQIDSSLNDLYQENDAQDASIDYLFINAGVDAWNGLTKTEDNSIGIGGLLNHDTSINTQGYEFEIYGGKISYDPLNLPNLSDSEDIVYRGYVDSSVADIYTILNKLTPEPPDSLSAKSLSTPGYYSARIESDGTEVSNITDDNTPSSTVGNFLKEVGINLIAYINGNPDGSIYITDSDMSGVSDQSLTITNDVDYYAGEPQKDDFYRILDAEILSDTTLDASINPYTYNLQYPDSGNETGTVSFYIDDPTSPSISNQNLDSSVASISRYISGVPSYADGDSIGISYRVDGAIGKFYHSSTLGNANLNAGDSINSGLPGTPPSEGDNVSFNSQTLTFGNNEYYENGNISINITPYNSKGTYTSGDGILAIPGRIDTVSNENDRVLSGYGDYPTSGYGGTFDSSISLKIAPYDAELHNLNGLYRWPTGDYSGWRGGPNYNTGLDASTRWVTFSTTITDVTGFNIQFNNTTNFTANDQNITQNIKIFAKVDDSGTSGTNGWIDCNKAYNGVDSNVTDDGEGAMEVNNSSATYKSCTFGSTLKSGTLYIRVGLEQDSILLFEDISITT